MGGGLFTTLILTDSGETGFWLPPLILFCFADLLRGPREEELDFVDSLAASFWIESMLDLRFPMRTPTHAVGMYTVIVRYGKVLDMILED